MVPDGPVLEHVLLKVFRSDLKNAVRNREQQKTKSHINVFCINSWSRSYPQPFQFSLFQNEYNGTKLVWDKQQGSKTCINSCMRLDYRLGTRHLEKRGYENVTP